MKIVFIFFSLLSGGYALSQGIFPEMGQLPSNAYPVCGTVTFRQVTVPYGVGQNVGIPGCGNLPAKNPSYYSFTCYASGDLGIVIEPLDTMHDFNWELFDITGHNANDIYTDHSLAIIGNWSGTYGETGARENGVSSTICLSSPDAGDSTFSTMPSIIEGHQYLLLVAGYSQVQTDYFLIFSGTAVITNPLFPRIEAAYVGCNKRVITVLLNKKIRCNSLASDGSDFILNGTSVFITGVSGANCDSQFDMDSIQLSLSDSLVVGSYSLVIKKGTTGTTLFDDCFNEMLEGEQAVVTVLAVNGVSADFTYNIAYGCLGDTVSFNYSIANGVKEWQWQIDSAYNNQLEPVIIKTVYDPMRVQHIVSNGFCNDTSIKTITLENNLKAGFASPNLVCPKDVVVFTDTSTGNIVSWNWNFGDGTSSKLENPPAHIFDDVTAEKKYHVTLAVENDMGCIDTASIYITKLQSCYITVPGAFTPNGDGRNDYLYPLNAFQVTNLEFRVFNRAGQLVFETRDWSRKWDGTINGNPQDTGTYVWTLSYNDGPSGKKIFLQGTSVLIR